MEILGLSTSVIIGLVILTLGLATMGLFPSKNLFPVEGRTVLITGASTGMGRSVSKLLAQKGANIVIVARNQENLTKALTYISSFAKNPSQQRFLAISADVTSASENQRILDETTAWNNGQAPDIVWANAGASTPGLFIDTELETHRAQFEVNYWSAVYLAHSTLKSWLSPSTTASTISLPRHFIMTSSSVAFVGVAGYTPYAPAKAALRSLADSLLMELQLYNGSLSSTSPHPPSETQIHLVCPGTILSSGYERENLTKHPLTKILEDGDPKQTEDQVAEISLKHLEMGRYLITTQFLGHAMRVSALAGSRRGNFFVDTVFSWITSLAWLFVGPDMERKAFNYGKVHGI